MATDADVAKLEKLQRIRRFAVIAAVVCLIVWYLTRNPIFVWPRVALWGAAGALSVVEALTFTKLGLKASNAWLNAAIYFGVAVIPLVKAM